MSDLRAADQIIDVEFLTIRAKILELAASLDRIERGEGEMQDEEPMELIQRALQILLDDDPQKAERIQLLFSREYDGDWRAKYEL